MYLCCIPNLYPAIPPPKEKSADSTTFGYSNHRYQLFPSSSHHHHLSSAVLLLLLLLLLSSAAALLGVGISDYRLDGCIQFLPQISQSLRNDERGGRTAALHWRFAERSCRETRRRSTSSSSFVFVFSTCGGSRFHPLSAASFTTNRPTQAFPGKLRAIEPGARRE